MCDSLFYFFFVKRNAAYELRIRDWSLDVCSSDLTIFTCARGSSDHAAAYGKFLFETRLRKTVSSHPPLMGSVYRVPMEHMAEQPFIVVSQSDRKRDV